MSKTSIEKDRAVEIVRLHNEIHDLLVNSVEKAMQIGKLLIDQKAILDQGDFGPWIKTHLPFTGMTASKYMRLYRERRQLKSKSGLALTQAYEMLRPSKPVASRVLRPATLDIKDIDPNPFYDRSRLVSEMVDWFVGAAETLGVYWLTVVRQKGDRYQNVCDHERYYALLKMGTANVPVSVISLNDTQMRETLDSFDYRHGGAAWKRLYSEMQE